MTTEAKKPSARIAELAAELRPTVVDLAFRETGMSKEELSARAPHQALTLEQASHHTGHSLAIGRYLDEEHERRQKWEDEHLRHGEATAKCAELLVRIVSLLGSLTERVEALEDAWSRRHEP